MSFEDVVAEMQANNLLVSDLHQTTFNIWHAALRSTGDWTTMYGKGKTAEAALREAMAQRKPRVDWKKVTAEQERGGVKRIRANRKRGL
jgi:hypothetical protein